MSSDAGAVIGDWTLLELLGEGGMGEVWRARGPNGLAAVKLLRAEAELDGPVRRFTREAKVLMELDHPNVVRAFDFGKAEDGRLFLAMEVLEGESLGEKLEREGLLSVDEVVRIGAQAAEGVAAAHDAGIVHRDLKPANLFVCSDGTVKVLDFGLALRADGGGRETRLTRTGALLGTPSYMAPEQASGERNEGTYSDIWGMSAVLHRALSGQPPFTAGGQLVAELYRIIFEPPHTLPDHVPDLLRELIVRGLEKAPEDRFQSMLELADRLGELAEQTLIGGGPAPVPVALGAGKAEPAPSLDAEVRVMSVLLAEDFPDDAAVEAFLATVQRYGGAGASLRGHGGIGVFGGDSYRGDEPLRALRSGLEACAWAGRLGVGTGKAVMEAAGGGVSGGALALAREAMAEAAGWSATGQVVIGGRIGVGTIGACLETRRQVQGEFLLEGVRVLQPRVDSLPTGVRHVGGRPVPFVGRDRELAQLRRVVEEAVSNSEARAVMVVGGPGMGKSRLRWELQRSVEAEVPGLTVLVARSDSAQALSCHAVVHQMLMRRAGAPEWSDEEAARESVEAMVAEAGLAGDALRGTADFVGELVGVAFPENEHLRTARVDSQVMGDRIRLALGDLFAGWLQRGPLLVVLEDVQWADAPSVSLIDFLLLRFANRPLVVLATARPVAVSRQMDSLPRARRIRLEPLATEHLEQIVEAVLGRRSPELAERAAGNPFFAEELGLVVRAGGDPSALPLTVEGAVQARLADLDSGSRDVLKRASVLGNEFWTEAVVALGEEAATRILSGLEARGLVQRRKGARLAGCTEWSFGYTLLREVCLHMLTDEQRQSLHRLAGRWMSQRRDAQPGEVAAHFALGGDDVAAGPFWMAAAHAAHARGNSEDVLRFASRALGEDDGNLEGAVTLDGDGDGDGDGGADDVAATTTDILALSPADEHTLRRYRAEAYGWRGIPEAEERELDRLAALERSAEARIPDAARVAFRLLRTSSLKRAGRSVEAQEAAQGAIQIATQSGDRAAFIRARAALVPPLTVSGELDLAAEIAEQVEQEARELGDPITMAEAKHAQAVATSMRGLKAEALSRYRDTRQAFVELGNVRRASQIAMNIGAAQATLGDLAGARETLEEALLETRALGLRVSEGWVEHNLGLVLARLGEPDAGVAAERRALDIARDGGSARLVNAALLYRSVIFLEAHDADAALADADAVVEGAGAAEQASLELLGRTLRACALVVLERSEEAVAECEAAMLARDVLGGMEQFEIDLHIARYEALLMLRRDSEAAAALNEAQQVFDTQLAAIDDPALRRGFAENIPAHRRLKDLVSGYMTLPAG